MRQLSHYIHQLAVEVLYQRLLNGGYSIMDLDACIDETAEEPIEAFVYGAFGHKEIETLERSIRDLILPIIFDITEKKGKEIS